MSARSTQQLLMVHTFSATTNTTTNPHARVQVQIPRVTGLHVDVNSERIGLRIDLICLSRVIQLFQGFPRPNAPSLSPHGNVCRRVVVCLEEVAGVEVGGEVGCDELFVLSARLAVTASVRVGHRSTIPDLPPRCLCPSDHSSGRRCIPPNCAVPKYQAQH